MGLEPTAYRFLLRSKATSSTFDSVSEPIAYCSPLEPVVLPFQG
jgi:hypothetical protein